MMTFDESRSIKKVVKTRQNSREIFILHFHGHEQHMMTFDESRSIKKVD